MDLADDVTQPLRRVRKLSHEVHSAHASARRHRPPEGRGHRRRLHGDARRPKVRAWCIVPVGLGQRLRDAFEAGAFGPLGDLYAEDAVLDWSMPGRRAHATGSEAVVAQLGEWWRGRGELTRWDESAFPSGLTNEFARLAGGALARQRHFIQTVDGRIVRHQAYCARPQGATVEPLEDAVAGAVRAIGKIDRREPLTHAGQSGTGLERTVMAEGRRLV